MIGKNVTFFTKMNLKLFFNLYCRKIIAFKLLDVEIILLVNVEMPMIVVILTLLSRINSMLGKIDLVQYVINSNFN